MLDKDGKLPRIKGALLADAIATTAGAVLRNIYNDNIRRKCIRSIRRRKNRSYICDNSNPFRTVTVPVTNLPCNSFFLTAPALIIVGLYMLTNVMNIDFSDMSEAIPCYICIIAMPFFYSISEGISMGIIAYVAFNLITGKAKEKKVSVLMYVLAVLFILKYIFL